MIYGGRITIRAAIVLLSLLVFALLLLGGCARNAVQTAINAADNSQRAEAPVELNVSAAASLKNALQKLAPAFEAKESAKLFFNFGASGDLQTQIEQGAPADVFISAGAKQMDALDQKGLITSTTRVKLLGNNLVIVAPAESKLSLAGIEELGTAKSVNKIAVGNPDTVPAGKYAKEMLEAAKLWTSLRPKLIEAKDVRQVLSYVETGNVDIGFVYRSDAKIAKNAKVILEAPADYHKPIVYPAAVIKDSKQATIANAFIAYMQSSGSMRVFEDFGFEPAQ